jgi:LmbE family N-acetylglucosaminyl deacetylase
MSFDALVIAAHPDDAEAQMGGVLARLSDRGQKVLLVDLSDGEPTDFGARGWTTVSGRQGVCSWNSTASTTGIRSRSARY